MEPVVITGNSARPETEFYTAKEMFDRGRLAKAFDKYEDCVRFFSVVISDFMNTRYGSPRYTIEVYVESAYKTSMVPA